MAPVVDALEHQDRFELVSGLMGTVLVHALLAGFCTDVRVVILCQFYSLTASSS